MSWYAEVLEQSCVLQATFSGNLLLILDRISKIIIEKDHIDLITRLPGTYPRLNFVFR